MGCDDDPHVGARRERLVESLDVLHRGRDEGAPARNVAAPAGAGRLIGDEHRLARLVQPEQVRLDDALPPLIAKAHQPVVEDGSHQPLAGVHDLGRWSGSGLLVVLHGVRLALKSRQP